MGLPLTLKAMLKEDHMALLKLQLRISDNLFPVCICKDHVTGPLSTPFNQIVYGQLFVVVN